jgi:hypothetical protein
VDSQKVANSKVAFAPAQTFQKRLRGSQKTREEFSSRKSLGSYTGHGYYVKYSNQACANTLPKWPQRLIYQD